MRAAIRRVAAALAWAAAVTGEPQLDGDGTLPPVGRCHAVETERGGLPKHRVAMAAIVNNEGRWIGEWILFHRLLGIDHFYVYDDSSTDYTREVVRAFGELGWTTLHEDVQSLKSAAKIEVPEHVRFTPQYIAVQHAARTYARETEWLALFDVDEFILPRTAEWSCISDGLSAVRTSAGVLRVQGTLFLPNTTDSRPLPPARLLLDTAHTFVPSAKLQAGDRVPLHKNFARPAAIAHIDHNGIHNMHARRSHKLHLLKPQQLFFAHFRYRTMSDFALKKRKAYAGHANKGEVWSRLTAALAAYTRVAAPISAEHPLKRYVPAVRSGYEAFRAWYARPAPRPLLVLPDVFGSTAHQARGLRREARGRSLVPYPAVNCTTDS